MEHVIAALHEICEAKPDRAIGSQVLTFRFGEVVTTIRVVFNDEQSGADMVITHMTTLPETERSKGFGEIALVTLLNHVQRLGLTHIEAVQVQRQSERFWAQNFFVPMGNITNDFRYEPPSL